MTLLTVCGLLVLLVVWLLALVALVVECGRSPFWAMFFGQQALGEMLKLLGYLLMALLDSLNGR